MPQVLGLVLIWGAAIAGYKVIQRVAGHMAAANERAAKDARRQPAEAAGGAVIKDLGALEPDPQSGIYRPRES